MRVNSVVWLVAYKEPDEDTYQSDEYVYEDFQEAFDACMELQTHDPMCDPRIVQVILDPVMAACTEPVTMVDVEHGPSRD